MIGTILDKYEVLQKVGEGGMATVYRGRHTTLDRDVAIKVLHPHLSSSTRNRKRFAREAKAIEHLRHDNILEIFDYSGDDADECYIVTEFVHGQTLTEVMNRVGKMPSEVVAMIGLDLAQALDAAHDAGILHRDIKPDNVMLRLDGTVKLMDFGIARFLDETQVTMTGALVGSPAFMSPEQAGEGKLDARSDLFSLGTVLFYLVTGHLPFSGSNPSIVLKNIIEGNRPAVTELCPTMSASLADVVERLLQRDREARFDTAAQVIEALQGALSEVGIDRDQPQWRLVCWLADPGGFERKLEAHLHQVLYDRGRDLLEQNDTLAALRLLNRLLSMDEDNEKVLALVQGLHVDPAPADVPADTRPRSWWPLAAVAGLLAFGGGITTWALSRPAEATPVVAESVAPKPIPVAPLATSEAPAEVKPKVEAEIPLHVPAPDPTAAVLKSALPRVAVPKKPEEKPLDAPIIAPPPVEGYGELRISTFPNPAELKCDGKTLGSVRTKKPYAIKAGSHDCVVTNPGKFEDYPLKVTLSAGEVFEKDVKLVELPAFVDLTCAPECEISVDEGAVRARVADLRALDGTTRRYLLENPSVGHHFVVACDGKTVVEKTLGGSPRYAVACPK